MILQTNPQASYFEHKDEIDTAIQQVLCGGWYILGKKVELFEQQFSRYLNSKHCISVANGTDAIEITLRALGIGNGDLVATTANTAIATVSAIERTGASVRFVDIEPKTFNISPTSLSDLLKKEPKIKAVIPVHLFGCPVQIQDILEIAQKFAIPVLEDCAQAHGATANGKKCGTFGVAGAFSFYPTKNLGAFGDGGCIVTDSDVLAEKIYSIRQYGWKERYISDISGVNSRLDEIQAAILSVKLPYLETDNRKRAQIAAIYSQELNNNSQVEIPSVPDSCTHVFHQYVIKTPVRDSLKQYLDSQNIKTALHYPLPAHQQPAYKKIPLPVSLENTEKVNEAILSLPIYPQLSLTDAETVADTIKDFYRAL